MIHGSSLLHASLSDDENQGTSSLPNVGSMITRGVRSDEKKTNEGPVS